MVIRPDADLIDKEDDGPHFAGQLTDLGEDLFCPYLECGFVALEGLTERLLRRETQLAQQTTYRALAHPNVKFIANEPPNHLARP